MTDINLINKTMSNQVITKLSPSQQQILKHAITHTYGKLVWFPDALKGYARNKVLDSLFKKALITTDGDDWLVTAEGYELLQEAPVSSTAIQPTEVAEPRTHANSKQAQVIAMLKRPQGATIPEIFEATGWSSHTVRGTFYGVIKKRLQLKITSTKEPGSDRIYRITSSE